MRYIIAQEKNDYGAWQCTIATQSIIDLKVNPEDIYILLGDFGYNKQWNDFRTRFPKVQVHSYRNHSYPSYKPAVKPYLLWQFFKQFQYLEKEQWYLVDNDVILTKKLKRKKKGIVHTSNCASYLNLDYLNKKGDGLAEGMAKHCKIDFNKIIDNDMGAGGAQYVFDNVSYTTWEKAYRNSVFLHNYLHRNQNTFNRLDTENCVQVWCAEMWGVLWSLWDDGHKSIINREMDFVFATDNIDTVKDIKIIHNAGVTSNSDGLFNKGDYSKKSPKDIELDIDKTKVSYFYYSYLKKVL